MAAALLALLGAALYFFAIGRAGFSPEAAKVAALRQQLSQLQEQFEALAARAPDKALVSAPGDGLVIGVPTDVARDVAQQIVAGYLGKVRLTLRRLRVHKSDDVEARILFTKQTVGSYDLEAEILVVQATLRPRDLRVSFEGKAFDELMAEQGGRCRGAVEKADVKQKLAEILARGFEVKLPDKLLHEIALPISVQESLKLEDGSYTLEIKPAHVVMTPPWIWYGTSVTIERAA